MTTTLTERITEAVISKGWNQGDLDALDELVAPGYIRHLSDGRMLNSREEFKQHIATLRAGMPDLHTEVHLSFSDGIHGAARFTTTGTPAGRPLRFEGAVIIRIEGGMLVEEWEHFDTAAIQKALGQ